MSDSPGLVDFAIGLLRNSNNRRTVKAILRVKTLLGLVEMTSGLVNASFSFPKWQAVKMIFFAPCLVKILPERNFTNYALRKPCFYHPKLVATECFKSSHVNRLIFSYDIDSLM